MKKRWFLHRLFAVGLLIIALALFGCGDDGDRGPEGPQGPPGPEGPQGPSSDELARGVDSPNASLCYSCHQHDNIGFLPANVLRAHMDNMGGEMFGDGAHGKEPKEGCVACHGGFRPGGDRPDGLSDELHAGFQHQRNRTPGIWGAAVDDVTVSEGQVDVTFSITSSDAPDAVNVEITLAKELADGSWMSMLQRTREFSDGIKVIRSGNLRLEDADILNGGVPSDNGVEFSTPLLAPDGDYENATGNLAPIDFRNGVVWRRDGDVEASSYIGGPGYEEWVQSKINEINDNGAWESGIYRISVTGRDRGSDYVRFAAIADFELTGSGATATVVPNSIGAPRPTNQIEQASCNTCHGDRLSFPRNTVHGQQRLDVNTCFNCHNNYTWDSRNSTAEEDGWARLDMATMIHSIHSGIEGYRADAYLYENVSYPDWTLPGTSNCASCHFGDVPGGEEGWNRSDPSIAYTCGSCHGEGGYAFDTAASTDHGGTRGYNCAECHDPVSYPELASRNGFQSTANEIHGVSARLEALRIQREDFAFRLVGVEDAVYGATPVVRWQVLKWQQNANGNSAFEPLELTEEMIDGGPRLHIGWGIGDDWTNEGSGEKSAFGPRENDDGGRPVAVNVATGENGNTVIEGDIAITTFPAFTNEDAGGGQGYANLEQATQGRRGFVAIHRNINDNGATRLLSSLVQPVMLGTGEVELAPSRRTSVNATTNIDHATNRGGSCLSCHGTIAWHGNGYTADNNIQACITCHNAGSHQSIAAAYPDPPYSVDMMYLMHKAHSDPEILYPQNMPGRCHACHAGSNEAHPVWTEEDGITAAAINVNSLGASNCALCHGGEIHDGRLGVISDWPGSVDKYGLRGDGTDGE